jgi:hypothetical protein
MSDKIKELEALVTSYEELRDVENFELYQRKLDKAREDQEVKLSMDSFILMKGDLYVSHEEYIWSDDDNQFTGHEIKLHDLEYCAVVFDRKQLKTFFLDRAMLETEDPIIYRVIGVISNNITKQFQDVKDVPFC